MKNLRGSVPLVKNNHIIILNFTGKDELQEVIDFAEKNGFKRFDPTLAIISAVSEKMSALDLQSTAPICPVHNKPMRLSNNGKGYYCTQKTKSGFCTERSK